MRDTPYQFETRDVTRLNESCHMHVALLNELCHMLSCPARGGGLGSSTIREVGGWGRVPFSRNLMSPTPRRKWYLTTGRRAH